MRRLGQWMTGALVVWALLLGLAWVTSEGEPVCEGPLITSVDDAFPPQCPGRIEGLFEVGPFLLGLSLAVASIGFVLARSQDDVIDAFDESDAARGGRSHRN